MTLGQCAISKPFQFFILITILIQAMQAGRQLIFCQPVVCWLVSYVGTKMSMVMIMGMRSKTDLLIPKI